MKPFVTQLIISALKGESGSNPEIHTCFPNDCRLKLDKLITKTLPESSRNGDVFGDSYKGQEIVVFVCELKQDKTRNDIVSISFLLNDFAEKSTIISVVKTIFTEFRMENIEEMDEFVNVAKKLFHGINKGNFAYDAYSFDIHGYLSNTGMSMERDVRKVRGGLF